VKPDLAARLLKLSSEASVTREEILDALRGLSDEERRRKEEVLTSCCSQSLRGHGAPLPGPQTLAYYSEAEHSVSMEGSAGWRQKTDLLLGDLAVIPSSCHPQT